MTNIYRVDFFNFYSKKIFDGLMHPINKLGKL